VPSLQADLERLVEAHDPENLIDEFAIGGVAVDDYTVVIRFEEQPPTGWLAQQLTRLDRSFRLGTRFSESDLSVAEFVSSRRRGIPIADGLRAEALIHGSLSVRLKPSKRMRQHLRRYGLAELALVIAILNGSVDFVDKLAGDPLPNDPDTSTYCRHHLCGMRSTSTLSAVAKPSMSC
jgi:hypothetical protein